MQSFNGKLYNSPGDKETAGIMELQDVTFCILKINNSVSIRPYYNSQGPNCQQTQFLGCFTDCQIISQYISQTKVTTQVKVLNFT